MKYVALLRGINIGGRNKVVMSELKLSLERVGFSSVVTYINSGNVLFSSDAPKDEITDLVSSVIRGVFGLDIKVLLRSKDEIDQAVQAMNDEWHADKENRYDVMFLWEEMDSVQSIDLLTVAAGVDHVEYIPGALLWRVSKEDYGKSGMNKLIGTNLYKNMTVRNSNTVRKIAELFDTVEAA